MIAYAPVRLEVPAKGVVKLSDVPNVCGLVGVTPIVVVVAVAGTALTT